jgi:organic radical activating enzyme
MDDDKEFRCIMPFSHVNVTGRGAVLPCCNYDWKKADDEHEHTKKDTPYHNSVKKTFHWAKVPEFHWIQDAGLTPILHSKDWSMLRKKSAKNIPAAGCHDCYRTEKSGSGSRRIWANTEFPDADKDVKLTSMELKLGAKCNLECRSCSGPVSNKLLREESYINDGVVNKNYIKKMTALSSWINDETTWDHIKEASKDLEYIQFTGGEPLIIPQHYKFLEWMAENNVHPTIQYITNGTIGIDEYKENIWDKFSRITFDFSLDATEELGEYVRTGSVWSEQVKNVLGFADYCIRRKKDNKHSFMGVAITTSIMNVHNMRPLLDFINELNDRMSDAGIDDVQLSTNIVYGPDWMDIANLRGEAKIHALEHVQSIIDDTKYKDDNRNKLKCIVDRMNDDPTTDLKFTDMIQSKDKAHNFVNPHRDISFERVAPEWWDMLKRSGM